MKLFFQQMMAFLAVTVATLLIVGLVFIQFTRDSVYRTKWHSLQEYADSIFQQSVVLDPQDSSVTTVRVDQLMGMERLLNNQHIHFTIYTENGERVSYPNDNTATQISKKQWRELNKGNILRQESRMAVGQVKHRITMTELKKPYFDRQGKLICVIAVGPLTNRYRRTQGSNRGFLFLIPVHGSPDSKRSSSSSPSYRDCSGLSLGKRSG